MLTIDSHIKEKNFSNLYLIYGEERYMVLHHKNSLIKAIGLQNPEMNFAKYEGNKIDVSELMDTAQTLPFLDEYRVILVENSGLFEKANDFKDSLETVPDTTIMIFVEMKADTRTKQYKYVLKSGCVTEDKPQNDQTLMKWVVKGFERYNKKIEQRDAAYLIQRVGNNMELLDNEMKKLSSYVGEEPVVTKADIDKMCAPMLINNVFTLLDHVVDGNADGAIRYYHDILKLGEKEGNILRMLIRHMNILFLADDMAKRGFSKNEIAKNCGVNSYFIDKYLKQTKVFGSKKIKELLTLLGELNEDCIRGKNTDKIALDSVISHIILINKE